MKGLPYAQAASFWTCWIMILAGSLHAEPMRNNDAIRIRMDNPLLFSRSDPLINPGAPSSHYHTIYGSNAFNITMDDDTARSGSCSTTTAQDDLSSYWHPTIYYLEKNGTYTIPPQSLGAYYGPGSTTNETIHPIPKGLRFLIGSPMDHTAAQFNARVDASGINTIGLYACNTIYPNIQAVPSSCTGDIAFMIRAPPCWDGQNLFLEDSTHMAMVKKDQNCPSTHPVRIMGISFFAGTKRTDGAPAAQGLMLANGDTTGRGFHLDFVAGWKDGILQAMLDNCRTPIQGQAIDTYSCPPLVPGGIYAEGACLPTGMYYRESNYLDKYSIKQLPGCNPIWPADQAAMPACDYTPNSITLMQGSSPVQMSSMSGGGNSATTSSLPQTTGTGVWLSSAPSTTIVITTASVSSRCGAAQGTRTVCATPLATCETKLGAGISVCSASSSSMPTTSAPPQTTGTGVWLSSAPSTTIVITTASVSSRCGAAQGTRTVCATPLATCMSKQGAGISVCSASTSSMPTSHPPVTTGSGVWMSTAPATTIQITTASANARCGAQFGTRTVCATPLATCKSKTGAGISTCSPAPSRVALRREAAR